MNKKGIGYFGDVKGVGSQRVIFGLTFKMFYLFIFCKNKANSDEKYIFNHFYIILPIFGGKNVENDEKPLISGNYE